MKKLLLMVMSLSLVFALLSGCTSPGGKASPAPTAGPSATDGSVKTGLAVLSSIAKSTDATAEKEGLAQVDSTVVAVTVGTDGKIVKCVIDAVQTKIGFSNEGKITTDLAAPVETKNELGDAYGMKKNSDIGKEWAEQAAALSKYVEGKTIAEVKSIAVKEGGYPTAADLTASVTVSISDYVSAMEKAVKNAKDLGAKEEDKLGLGITTTIDKSKDAADADGVAQAYSHYVASTFGADGKITSSMIDASQTDVNFSKEGKITSDLKAAQQTKVEKGDAYNMKKESDIGKEWYVQAENFAKYITGKGIADVKGIALNETGAPTVADLTSSVTVSVGNFISALEKAEKTKK